MNESVTENTALTALTVDTFVNATLVFSDYVWTGESRH